MQTALRVWARQFSEHAQFSLDDLNEVKSEANELKTKLESNKKQWAEMGKQRANKRQVQILVNSTLRLNRQTVKKIKSEKCEPALVDTTPENIANFAVLN